MHPSPFSTPSATHLRNLDLEYARQRKPRPNWQVGIVFVCLVALNVTPIRDSAGGALACLSALICVFNPFATFLYVAGSQIAPDPSGFPFTLAQLFVVAWVVTLPFNGCARHLTAAFQGLRYSLVFIVLWTVIGIANQTIDEPIAYAFIAAAILSTYLPKVSGDETSLLLMLALGCLIGVAGYWGTAIGISMEGEVYEHASRGGTRMGSGRADVNFASVNIGFGLWTLIALLLPTAWMQNQKNQTTAKFLIVVVFVACALPLVAMGSRAGLGYLILGGVSLLLYSLNTHLLAGAAQRYALIVTAVVIFVLPFIWPNLLETKPGQMLLATLEYNSVQSQGLGSGTAAAGRQEIWQKFYDIAIQYPFFGAPKNSVVDMGEYGVAIIGVAGSQGGTGHNFFLDLAAGHGIPIAFLFVITFIAPVIVLLARRGALYTMPFVIAHAMVLLPFLNLSILNWKTYWALHVITAYAACKSVRINKNVPSA
ncbi:MAG: O-antigen ligase family protein [Hyphomicrobiaceae bacterium]